MLQKCYKEYNMKSHKILSMMLFMFCCLYTGNNAAWARGHVGFYFGGPWYPFYGYGFPYPYAYPYGYPYAPPAVVTVPAAPQTYVQQSAPPQTNYWHYCNNPEGYYPYVKACPGGWQLVEPTPQR
jgi:hypothetical protein